MGLIDSGLPIGSRLRFTQVELEVAAPRIPCSTLATRMNDDPAFVKRFLRAERPGMYCRVLAGGALESGEGFDLKLPAGEPVTTIDLFRACQRKLDATELRRFLAVELDARTRESFRNRLTALET
jgi:MOSC domain-containing protein YiiM